MIIKRINCTTGQISEIEISDENVNLNYINVVNFEPEKRYEIKAENEKYLKLIDDVPELGVYRKQKGIEIYYLDNYIYFYVDSFLPGHKEILEQYLGENSITDRQNGNE